MAFGRKLWKPETLNRGLRQALYKDSHRHRFANTPPTINAASQVAIYTASPAIAAAHKAKAAINPIKAPSAIWITGERKESIFSVTSCLARATSSRTRLAD